MRLLIVIGCAAASAMLVGCAPGAQQQQAHFELRKLEQERDALKLSLHTEQARADALQQRMEAEQLKWSATRAEVARLREQLDKLTQHNQDLQVALDRIRDRNLERPVVPVSPLPAAVDQALQALADRFSGRIWYDQARGAVSFANDRLFDSGSDVVRTDAHAALHELAAIMALPELTDHDVIVVGHTDATPITKPETLARHPSNWHLSVHRALAVKDVLATAGVPASRLGVMGYGDQRPVGDDPARNRRVEVFIVPRGDLQSFQPVRPGR